MEARLGLGGGGGRVVLDIAVSITTNGWGEERGLHINIKSPPPPFRDQFLHIMATCQKLY